MVAIPKRRSGHGIHGAIFAEAKKRGIDSEDLRNTIAPAVLGKRMSKSTEGELVRLLRHLQGKPVHEASLEGLRKEVRDLAVERYGPDFEKPLNALCKRFGVNHWRWLDVRHAKAVKATLLRLQRTA